MPQTNQNYIAKNPSNVQVPLLTDAQGALQNTAGGVKSALNVAASTAVKATPGRVITVNVLVAGAVGAIHDCAATGDAAAGNKVAVIPAVVGVYRFDFPCLVGITYVPGASQVVSISYN